MVHGFGTAVGLLRVHDGLPLSFHGTPHSRQVLPKASHDVRRRRDDGAEFKEAVLGSRSDVPELVDVASRFPHDGSISGQEGAAPEDDGFEA